MTVTVLFHAILFYVISLETRVRGAMVSLVSSDTVWCVWAGAGQLTMELGLGEEGDTD